MENSFETRFAGLSLKNPIIIASSGLTNTAEKNKDLEKAGAGAIILRSLYEEQIEIQTNPEQLALSHRKMNDFIWDSLKCAQIADYLKLIQESKNQCRIPVIASINCYREDTWIDFVRQIEMAGADAIELNIFALDIGKSDAENSLENNSLRITKRVKELVRIPVIVKISKYFSHTVDLAEKLQSAGADGIVLFSRFYQPDIDIHKLQANSGYVFSSQTDIGETLRWAAIVTGKLPEISLASCTGIHDWEDIVKCILCGASAVEICSTVYQHGNEIIPAMLRSMEEWMSSMHFDTIREFKGKLNFAHIEDPSLYERGQFIKYFSNRD
ncbi:MAG: dihydroorotate dehydrogenase-like protein [Dysgonamonadaceae bacterium]|jgi:dihydroorotate dehydrogenase (fumarate)|nr:dihydroorotate dehydrogenase-like protein [Dysgonamonadaceae bacterium]